jgi:two-component system phosphate regulon sensor histidine kinase PhoR
VRNYQPKDVLIVGNLILTGFLILLLSIISFFNGSFSLFEILIIPLITGVTSYLIFYILIGKFIHQRLQVLFRIIRKGKLTDEDISSLSIRNSDILEKTEEETNAWVKERQSEIARLKEQEAFRKEFLGNLAHELKTPVFSIQGYILTLLEGGLEDENVNRKFLERASKATERITSLLEDLDDITKMEVNRFELHITKFDLVELAQEVMDSLELPSTEKGIKIGFNKKYDPIYVKADRSRISQVFTNLISNSIHYGKENGETTIRFYPMEEVIMTEVSDNGFGISEKDVPRLFERFYRVEQSRNRKEGGSGLGLAIVKHIIETQHNQTINVRSTIDVGSTFSFTLPRSK